VKAVFVENNGPIDPNTGCHPLLLPGDIRMLDQRERVGGMATAPEQEIPIR